MYPDPTTTMKISPGQRGGEEREVRQRMSSLRKIENFCCSYDPEETDDMLCKLLSALREDNFLGLDQVDKENLLDYIEALEELLPAVDEINKYLATLAGQVRTFQDHLDHRRIIASMRLM